MVWTKRWVAFEGTQWDTLWLDALDDWLTPKRSHRRVLPSASPEQQHPSSTSPLGLLLRFASRPVPATCSASTSLARFGSSATASTTRPRSQRTTASRAARYRRLACHPDHARRVLSPLTPQEHGPCCNRAEHIAHACVSFGSFNDATGLLVPLAYSSIGGSFRLRC